MPWLELGGSAICTRAAQLRSLLSPLPPAAFRTSALTGGDFGQWSQGPGTPLQASGEEEGGLEDLVADCTSVYVCMCVCVCVRVLVLLHICMHEGGTEGREAWKRF